VFSVTWETHSSPYHQQRQHAVLMHSEHGNQPAVQRGALRWSAAPQAQRHGCGANRWWMHAPAGWMYCMAFVYCNFFLLPPTQLLARTKCSQLVDCSHLTRKWRLSRCTTVSDSTVGADTTCVVRAAASCHDCVCTAPAATGKKDQPCYPYTHACAEKQCIS
jgi:hypothetical protein